MENRYSVLEGLRKKLVSLNLFTRVSDELDALDEVMEWILEDETTPDDGKSGFQDLQKKCIHLQTMLNQCESSKDRIRECLQTYKSNQSHFEIFNNKKIGIVGGHRTDVEKLRLAIQEESKDAKIKFKET